jgi:hypothetical protein
MLVEQCEPALQQALELAVLRRWNQRRFQRPNNKHVVSELILSVRLVKGCAAQFREVLPVFGPRARQRLADGVILWAKALTASSDEYLKARLAAAISTCPAVYKIWAI